MSRPKQSTPMHIISRDDEMNHNIEHKDKSADRERIERQIEEFLAGGGEIKEVGVATREAKI